MVVGTLPVVVEVVVLVEVALPVVEPAPPPPLPAGGAEEPRSTRYTPDESRGGAPGTR
ncbi:MAG TPA: hypothetical protein VFN45_00875 [Myxococcaceae bacterium]|nr:hypothetical protein [Myxococcaceae bacterium]